MNDMSHTISITADLKKVREAATKLKAHAPSAADIEADPKGYLAKLGVEIDDQTAAAVKARFAKRSATPSPAAIIHIDV